MKPEWQAKMFENVKIARFALEMFTNIQYMNIILNKSFYEEQIKGLLEELL